MTSELLIYALRYIIDALTQTVRAIVHFLSIKNTVASGPIVFGQNVLIKDCLIFSNPIMSN